MNTSKLTSCALLLCWISSVGVAFPSSKHGVRHTILGGLVSGQFNLRSETSETAVDDLALSMHLDSEIRRRDDSTDLDPDKDTDADYYDVDLEPHKDTDTNSYDMDAYLHKDNTNSKSIFDNILTHVAKGHINKNSLSMWMEQIQHALSRGIISNESVKSFIDELNGNLAGTSLGDKCCPLG